MKFCYIDESGTGSESYAVMVGVIVDASRMHVTKKEWSGLLNELSKIAEHEVLEIHTRDFYAGNGPWRGINGEDRNLIISTIFKWLRDRKHEIVYSAIDKGKFKSDFINEPFAKDVKSYWSLMAIHIVLSIQKYCQNFDRNKGHSVLIFDNEVTEADDFINFIRHPPEWIDTYYARNKKKEQIDQIIDVPYFVDSKHVGLIQLADFISFFLRKYIDIREGVTQGKYADEQRFVAELAKITFERSIPKPMIYLSRGRCNCADLFYRYAPRCLLT